MVRFSGYGFGRLDQHSALIGQISKGAVNLSPGLTPQTSDQRRDVLRAVLQVAAGSVLFRDSESRAETVPLPAQIQEGLEALGGV